MYHTCMIPNAYIIYVGDANAKLHISDMLSPYRVWLSTHICVLRITPIYR
jgi:hypothetical protein